MNIQNHIPFSSYDPNLPPSSEEKQKTESPSKIDSTSIHNLGRSSSQSTVENVPTNPISKGILKKTSAYSFNEKVPTKRDSRSVSFAENSTDMNSELKSTKPPSIKVATIRKQPGLPRSKSAPPVYLPDEYASDPSLEKAVADAGRFIAAGLSKAVSTVADFIKRPEDFFLPEQPPKKSSHQHKRHEE